MSKVYHWEHRLETQPYDKIVDVLEAFFASYPKGDYTCVHRERYKLHFRRGLWRKSYLGLGDFVPDKLVKGQFTQWPIIVQVLARPSPESFSITVRYELHLPKGMRGIAPELQASVAQHIEQELNELAAYLAECAGWDSPPEVMSA
jgi:hypothetical protein